MENSAAGKGTPWGRTDYCALAGRLILGSVFFYLGLVKAIDPIGFLKLLRQFDVMPGSLALNLIAAILPWLEMLCGLLLLAGVALRGTALLVLLMLAGFTAVIFLRALRIYESGTSAFCAIRFDCGCGAGDILICRKLAENAGLCVLAWIVLASRTRKPGTPKVSEA